MKTKNIFLILLFGFFSFTKVFSQPNWVLPYPTATVLSAVSVRLNFQLTGPGNIYWVVLGYDAAPMLPTSIKSTYMNPPSGSFRGGGTITYTAGDVGSVINAIQSTLLAGTLHSIHIVAESLGGTLGTTQKLTVTTPSCPDVYFVNGLQQTIKCVNKGATAIFNMIPDANPNISGILAGTTWVINWGDGTIYNYTSTADGDYPTLANRTHTYSSVTNCNYVFSCGVKNPCGKTFSPQYVAIVHGRDQASDGDGILEIVNNDDGSTLIQVCAGTQSTITIRDNSTWNCQNPTVPGGLTAVPNLDPRNIEWLYGQDPNLVPTNTITGTVTIAGLGNAPAASGRISPVPYGPASLAQAVTIPATCQAGQYFRVYLKNWNKCNWTDPEYIYTSVDILVIAAPPAPTVPNKTICFGGDRTLTVTSPAIGTLTWYSNAGLTIVVGTGNTYVPTNPAVGSYPFWVTDQSLTGLMCMSPATMVTLTILPVIANNSVAAAQTICNGATPAGLTGTLPTGGNGAYTYQWQSSPDNSTWSNIGGATGQNYAPGALASNTYYRRIVTSGPCSNTSGSILITVRPTATATISGTTTVCQGDASPNVTFTNPRTIAETVTYNINGGAPQTINVNASSSATVAAPTGVAGTFIYNLVSVVFQTVPTCSNALAGSATITVRPTPTATIAGTTTVCQGAASPNVRITNPMALAIRATYNINGAGSTNVNIPAGSFVDIAAPTGVAGTFVYNLTSVRYQDNSPGCTNALALSATITVRATPTATISGTITVCQGVASPNVTFTNPQALAVTVTYNINGGAPQTINVAASSSATVAAPTGVAGTFNYNLVSVVYQTAPTCSNAVAGTATITVRPTPTATISGTTAVCQNVASPNITFTNPQALPVTVTYNINGGANTTVNVAASASANVAAPTGTAGTFVYNLVNVYYQAAPSCTNAIAGSATVTVNPTPTPVISGINNVCLTGTENYSVPAAGGRSYLWTSVLGTFLSLNNVNPVTVQWNSIGAGSVTVTETITATGCFTTTAAYPVTVNPGAPVAAPTLTSGATNICKDGTLNIDVSDVATANQYIWDYSWVAGTNNATTAVSNISINLTGLAIGPYTVTVAGANGCGTGPWMNPVHSFTINDIPDLSPLSGNPCSDVASGVTFSITNAGVYCSGITYNITVINNGGLTASAGAPATGTGFAANVIADDAWTNTTGADVAVVYTVVPVSTQGCTGNAENVTLTVKSEPRGQNTTISTCSATALAYNIQTSNINALGNSQPSTFTWIAAANANVTGESTTSQSGGTINDNLVNTTNTAQTVVYTVTPTGTNLCLGNTFTVSVTVNPRPAINNLTATPCSGAAFTVTPANGTDGIVPAGTTYSWPVPVVTGGITGGAAGAGAANISGTLTNPTNIVQTATYTVTPLSGTCTGATFTVTVTVNPKPTIANKTATICSAGSFTVAPVNGADIVPAGTTYTWAAPVVTGGLTGGAAGANQPDISGTLTNPTNAAQTATYTVTPATASCTGSTFTVIVTVNPVPAITAMSATPCSASAFTVTPVNVTNGIVPAATTYTWAAPVVTGGLTGGAAGTNQPNIFGTLTNPTNTAQTATYTVTPATASCPGAAFTITVTVSPRPAITAMTASTCSAAAFTVSPVNITNGIVPAGTTYTWAAPVVTGGITGGAAGTNQANIFGTLTNPTNTNQTATYTVTPTAGSCTGAAFTITVTVNPKPAITNMTAPTCNGVAFSVTPVNITNGVVPAGTTYSWPAPVVTGGMTGGAAGANQPNISGTLVNSTSSAQTATYTVTPLSGTCTGSTFTVTVTVNPGPAITNMTKTSCSAVAFTVTPVDVTNGVVPAGTTYTWPAPVVTGGLTGGAAGTNQANIFGTLTNPTNSAQTATYTVTPTAGSCTGTPFTVTVTVNPWPAINNMTASACSQAAFTVSPVDGTNGIVPGGTTYTWAAPVVTGGMTGGAAGAAQATINGTLINPTNTAQTATYTVTPVTGICTGANFTVTVTVNPKPSVTPMTAMVCSESPFTVTPANGVNGVVPAGTTYSWPVPVVTGGLTGGATGSGAANISGTLTNPTLLVQTATYTVTPLSGTCTGSTFTVTVTVNPLPNTSAISGDAIICESAANKVYQVTNTPGSTYAWTVPASLTITSPPNLYFIIVDAVAGMALPTDQITVTETFTATTGCIGHPVVKPITVSPVITGVVVTGPISVCQGDAGVTYSVPFHAGSVYSWIVPAGAAITTDPTLNSIQVTFSMAVTGQVSVIETSGTVCTTFHTPINVTVNPLPTVFNLTSPVAYCAGDPGVTLTLSGSQVGVNYQLYNSLGIDGATKPGTGAALTWTNKLAETYHVVATNATTSCIQNMNGTVVPTINIVTGGTIGSDQAICENTAPDPLTNIASGGGGGSITYQWQSSPDNVTYTSIAGATSAVYTSGPITADTYFRRVASSTMGTSVCSSNSNTILVTVINFVPGSITADQTICDGDIPAAFTSVTPTGDGVFTYQWKSSTDNITFANIAGATSETYTSGALTADTWFKRAVTSILLAVPCTEETNTVKVTVINFTPGSIATDQTICEGSAPAAFTSVAPSGDGTFTYRWLNSTDNVTFNVIGGATSATYTSPAIAQDTWFKREVTSTLSGKTCVKETNVVKVTVNNFDPGTISAAQTICEGDAPASFTSVTPTGDGTFTYLWQFSTDGVTYNNISGATSETYTSGALTMDTYFRRQVTSTLGGTPCIEYTPAILVTVNNFTPGSISGAQTICEGDIPVAFTQTAPTGDGAFTYQWQNSADGTTFVNIGGATAATYAAPALTADTWYKRLVTSTLGGNTCTEESTTIKVTVNNLDPGSIGSDQTICENTAPVALTSVTPTGDGTFTYKWYSSADGVTFNVIPGAISETYAPSALAADTWYRREVTSTLNAKPCIESTNVVRITVNNFTPGTISTDQTICDGGTPAAFTSVTPTGDGVFTYQWKESPNGVAYTDIAGATSETYTPGALTADTWYKRTTISTLNGQTCSEETNIVRVTVINFIPGSIGSDQTICEGSVPAAFTSVAASGDGVKTYQWQNSTDNITFNNIGGATGATYASPALTQDTWFKRVVTSTLNGTPCTAETNTVRVMVNNFDPGTISAAQTICEDGTPAPFTSVTPTGDGAFTYQWQFSTDGVSYSNIPAATSETYSAGVLTVDTYFRRQVTSTLNNMSCVEYTPAILVTVNNFAPGSISGAQTICEGDVPASLTVAAPSGDGTFTFQWKESSDGATFTDIAGATAATYAPPALTADMWYKRSVTSTLNTILCTEETNTIKIMVNNFDPGSIGSDQTICESTAPTPLTSVTPTGDGSYTYRWFNSSDGVTFAVIPGAVSETYSPGSLTADTWYRREVTSTLSGKACVETTNVVRITINNFVPGSISTDQTICDGATPLALTSVTPTGDGVFTYQWKESANGVIFTDIAGATSETYAPGALTADTWYKRTTISTLNGQTCSEETNLVRITVINFAPGSIGSDQTICDGSAPAAFTSVAASGDGVKTYQWQSSTDNITFNNIAGATSATYTSPALTQDTWFKRVVTSTLNGTPCTQETNTILVTVNNFVAGSISADQTICEGDVPAAFTSVTPTGDGTFTYQWQSSLDGASYSNITGATSETYAPAALTADTWFRRQVTSTLNGAPCSLLTAAVLVTVNNFTPGSISASQTICEGDVPAAFTAVGASGDGTFTYQWQSSADGSTFANIAGETNATYSAPALTADTWYKRLATSTLGSNTCTEESNTIKVTVNNFDPGSIGSDQTICEGSVPTGLSSVAPTGDGVFTYKWYSSADGVTFGVIPGAISETYNPAALTADTWYRRDVTSTLSGKACVEPTNVVRITVNNFIPGSISADQTICEGVIPAALTSVTPTGDGVFTYQWEESTDGVNFSNIAGATSETYAPAALTADTWYRRATTSTLNTVACTEETNIIRKTVVNFSPGSIGSDQTICEGSAPSTFTSVAASGDGVKTYQWQNSTDNIAFANIGGATSATYASPALTQDTWFRRVVTSTLNGTPCTEITDTVRVTVNNFDPGSISAAQTICEGDVPAAFTSVTPTGDGTFTYQWQASLDGVSYSNLTGATSETYAAGALTADTYFRRQVTSTLNSMTCTEVTAAILVTVNNFTPGSISASQTICEGDVPAAFTSVAATGDGAFTYRWQSSADGVTFANMAGETNATYSAPALTADTWYKRLATSTLGANTCTEESNTIKVTVNNFDPGSIGADQTICENTSPAPLTSVTPTGDGVFTYRWFSSADGVTFSVIPGAISETYSPASLAADIWYRREVTSTLSGKACVEITNVVRITVNNLIPGSISADQTICETAVPAALTSVTPTGDGVFTYQWKESADGVAYTDIAGATSETFAPPALTVDTWYKRAVTSTLNAMTCTEETNIIRITVINFTAGSIGTDQTICDGTAPAGFTSVAPTGDGTKTYQWQNSTDNITYNNIGGATSATYTSPVLTQDTWFKRAVTSTLNGTSCTKETNIVLVTVNNFVPGSISADQTICEGDIPAPFTSVTPTGDGTFSYRWQSSTDGVIYAAIAGATSETYASPDLVQDTWFRRQVTSTLNGVPCVMYTTAIKVTVNNFLPGSISASQTICEGDVPAAFTAVAPSGDGTFTFQWQSSSDGITFAIIGGATAGTYAPPAQTADTWYKLLVTSTLGANTCTEETNTIKITVNNFDPGSIGSDQTICENSAPVALTSVSPTGDGAFTYKWYSSSDGVTFAVIAGAVSETYNPGVLAADTWYRREVTSTLSGKACVETTNAVRITVNNFVPGSISADQTICESTAPAALTSVTPTGDGVFTYQWKQSLDGVAFTDIAGATSETYSPAALTADTWYKRAVTSTLNTVPCTEETNVVRVTVINFNAGTIGTDQTICDGTAPATFTGTAPSGDGAFTYLWENSTDGVTYATIAGATASTYTSPALNADTWFRRTVTSTLNGTSCTLQTAAVKVTVNNFVPGSISAAQTICEGDTPAAFTSVTPAGDGTFTYQWQSSTDGVTFSNITGATSETYAAGALIADTWYRRQVISTLNTVACTQVTAAIKVTVNNFDPGSVGAAQTICEGDTPAAFTSVAPTGDGAFTYQWQNSTDGTTFANIGGATAATYTAPALTADTWYKRLVTSTIGANTCTEETNVIKVTVNNFDPGSIGSDQTICESSVPAPLSSVTPTGDGTFTYRWLRSDDGVTFVVIPGAINETYAPSALINDRWYKREVTSTLNGKACVEETNVIRVTVNNFVPGSVSADQTICESATPLAFTSVTPTGDGVFTYQWKSSTDGVNYVNITGATSETYTSGALTQDTWFIRSVISTLNAMTCTEETNFVKITVNNINGGTIISDQTICNGYDPVPFMSIVHGTGDGAVTWQWQSSADGVTFADIAGANALNYDSPALSADTWFKRITSSLLNAVTCTKESNVVKVTVNVVAGGTIAASQVICFGDTPAMISSTSDGSGSGTVTYQWMRSNDGVIWNMISGETLTTYTPGVHYITTYYKRTLISILGGVLCTSESNVVQITVNPLPVAILSGGATICPGESSILKVNLPAGLGPFELDIQGLGIVTNYVSDADITVSPLLTTTYKLLRVTDANGCEVLSPSANLMGTATITVRALPAITVNPVNRILCEFGMTTFAVTATGSDLTYLWYVNQGSGFNPVADGGVYFGAATATLSLFGTTRDMTGYIYHVIVSGCSTNVTSTDATLTVNTIPEITNQPKDTTICSTGGATFSVTATGTALTYQWQVKTTAMPAFANVVDGGIYSGATTNTLTLTGVPGTMNNAIFRVIISGTCGVPVYSNFVILRVNVPPTATINPTNKAICDGGGPVYFVANGSGMIDSLRWQVSTNGGTTWSDVHDNAVYSGSTTQQLALIGVPVSYNGYQYRLALKAFCATINTNAATLTVNSLPVITFASDPINACGNVAQVITPNIAGGSGTWTQHTWTGDVGPLNNYFIQSPTFKSQIAATYNLNYKVRDSNGCYGEKTVAVIVDAPDATFAQDVIAACTPATVNFTKDMTGITSFSWNYGDGSPLNTTIASPSHVYTNGTPSTILYRTVSLTVTSAGGCSDTKTSMVTVYPAVDATFNANNNVICSGGTIIFTGLPGAASYTWDFGDGVSGPGGSATTHLFTNSTTAPVVYTVSLTTSSFYGCSDTKTLNVTVWPTPVPEFNPAPTPQNYLPTGNPVTFTNMTNAGTWTWAWDFDDSGTSTAQSPSHTYTAIGTFNVKLTVSNAQCSANISHPVIILPVPPIASFDNPTDGCSPLAVTFSNTSQNRSAPGTTFRWSFGDGSYSTAENPDYTYFTAGIYQVELTVTGPGGTSTATQTVEVFPSPRAYFEVTPPLVFVNDEKVRCFNLSQGQLSDTYLWDFGDGDTSKVKEPFHKYMEEGVYDITLWAYSVNGCTDKFVLSPAVTVEPAGEVRFSTVFTPNKEGPIDRTDLPTGGTEIDQFFFPPIREKVINYKLQIFNRLGVLIFESRNINIPWNGYYKGKLCPQGVYVWYVEGKYANGKPFKKVGDVTLLH